MCVANPNENLLLRSKGQTAQSGDRIRGREAEFSRDANHIERTTCGRQGKQKFDFWLSHPIFYVHSSILMQLCVFGLFLFLAEYLVLILLKTKTSVDTA